MVAIEWEQSKTAALQITLFNQPWDFSANQLKQHLLHLHRCYSKGVRCYYREKHSCPDTDLVSHHRETKICTPVAFAQVWKQTDPATANQVTFLKTLLLRYFWATSVLPQYNQDNNQKYTNRYLYMVHSAHIPNDVTLLMYRDTHWKCLLFRCFSSGCSLFCWPRWQWTHLIWKTLKWNLTLGTNFQHSYAPLGIMFSVKTPCRSHLLLPLHGTFPHDPVPRTRNLYAKYFNITFSLKIEMHKYRDSGT